LSCCAATVNIDSFPVGGARATTCHLVTALALVLLVLYAVVSTAVGAIVLLRRHFICWHPDTNGVVYRHAGGCP
jgi:hypothetical protein